MKRKCTLQTWYFAFFRSGGRTQLPGWMNFCIGSGYTHVISFSQVDNCVQVLDPIHTHLAVSLRIHPLGPAHALPVELIALDFAAYGAEVLRITYPTNALSTSHHLTNWVPGCVTVAKALLGVAEWVFTPSQWREWLLENGGEVFDEAQQAEAMDAMFGRALSPDERKRVFAQFAQRRTDTMGGEAKKAAKRQEARMDEQMKMMREERLQRQKEAQKIEQENAQKKDAVRRRSLGRASLIGTSELGVTSTLGVG